MSKVAGKRYTYKFDFNGLMQACQQMSTVTSAETLAMSSSSSLHLAYIHRGGQVPPLVSSSSMTQDSESVHSSHYRSPPPYWLTNPSTSGSPTRWNAQSDVVLQTSPQLISAASSPSSSVTSQCSILYQNKQSNMPIFSHTRTPKEFTAERIHHYYKRCIFLHTIIPNVSIKILNEFNNALPIPSKMFAQTQDFLNLRIHFLFFLLISF